MGVRPRTRSFRVVGTFVSGMYEYDLKMAYLTQDDARDLFMLGGANRVAIMLDDLDDLEAVSGLIRELIDAEIERRRVDWDASCFGREARDDNPRYKEKSVDDVLYRRE